MKFYLSSYKHGDSPNEFSDLFSLGRSVAYIPNALDFTGADPDRVKTVIAEDVESLEALKLNVKVLDLKQYFLTPPEELENIVKKIKGPYTYKHFFIR